MHRLPIASLILAAAAAGGAAPLAAQDAFFLQLDGIKGESTRAGYEGQIEVQSFAWGETNASAPTGTGGGAGVGKASFQDLSVAMSTNRASPTLFVRCASGEHIKKAVLHGVRLGEKADEFYTLTLEDVSVGSVQTAGAGGDSAPNESVALRFAKLTVEYRPQNADGSLGSAVKGTVNLGAPRPQ